MKNIVPNENCLTETQLLQYLRDECSSAEEKAIDRHLTHCPLCSDALEGAMLLNSSRLERSLGRLDVKIETRFSDKKHVEQKATIIEEEPIMTVVKSPRKWGWLWAAASVVVLAAAGLWLFTKPMNYDVASPVVANTQPTTIDTLGSQTATPNNSVGQTETAQNTPNTGNLNNNQPLSTDKEVAVATPNTATSNHQADVATTTAQPTTSKPIYTEGATSKAKQEETYLDEITIADANNKTRKKESASQNAPAAESNINDYPGAAAQNSVPAPSQSRSAKVKQAPESGLADYQIGMRFYQKGAFNEAIAPLNRVLAKQNTPDVYQNALWYLANSYLKLGKKQEAQSLLQRIVSEKGVYAQQAAALLK
jgi:TolA-binding protein